MHARNWRSRAGSVDDIFCCCKERTHWPSSERAAASGKAMTAYWLRRVGTACLIVLVASGLSAQSGEEVQLRAEKVREHLKQGRYVQAEAEALDSIRTDTISPGDSAPDLDSPRPRRRGPRREWTGRRRSNPTTGGRESADGRAARQRRQPVWRPDHRSLRRRPLSGRRLRSRDRPIQTSDGDARARAGTGVSGGRRGSGQAGPRAEGIGSQGGRAGGSGSRACHQAHDRRAGGRDDRPHVAASWIAPRRCRQLRARPECVRGGGRATRVVSPEASGDRALPVRMGRTTQAGWRARQSPRGPDARGSVDGSRPPIGPPRHRLLLAKPGECRRGAGRPGDVAALEGTGVDDRGRRLRRRSSVGRDPDQRPGQHAVAAGRVHRCPAVVRTCPAHLRGAFRRRLQRRHRCGLQPRLAQYPDGQFRGSSRRVRACDQDMVTSARAAASECGAPACRPGRPAVRARSLCRGTDILSSRAVDTRARAGADTSSRRANAVEPEQYPGAAWCSRRGDGAVGACLANLGAERVAGWAGRVTRRARRNPRASKGLRRRKPVVRAIAPSHVAVGGRLASEHRRD